MIIQYQQFDIKAIFLNMEKNATLQGISARPDRVNSTYVRIKLTESVYHLSFSHM